MRSRYRFRPLARCLVAATSLLGAGLLAGCVVAPAPYYGYAGYPAYVTVPAPPPAPQVEVVGVAPAPGYLWISGFWAWGGARYVWHPGRWTAPRPGYFWVAPRWEAHGREWREQPGHWRRR